MASFTDQISQFNPYIQELPVEAMAQVGMAKQAQYNQGVQKVQNYVDRVAGLEIAKPQHKQYLQSKLDELGSRLKTVAAGDFSNQQLVNSVSGMTGQIIKDSIVQNAVYSTQVLKKGESDREIAVKAGKTSPANDDLWNDTKSAWFNNADLNTPFDGKFIERWDVDKKLTERAEMILKNPDVINQEQRFKHDEKGNTLYFGTEPVKDAQGKPVIDSKTKQPVLRQTISTDPSKGGQPQEDDAILKISVKGTSPEKLYNNFLNSLDSRDAQQLKIDARYKYKNATAESFAPDIAKFYGDKKAFQSQEIVNLTGALAEPDLTSEQKAAITARITDLQQQEKDGVIDKEFLSTMEALKDPRNLEKYKEDIYTQQHLMNMAKDMSFKSYEQEIKNNPYMQMFMQKQNYNLDVIKYKDDSRLKWANQDLARDKFAWDKYVFSEEFKFKTTEAQRKWLAENPPPIITTTTLPTVTTPKTVDDQWAVSTEKEELMKGLKNKYAERLFPGLTIFQQRQSFQKLYERYDTNPNGKYSPDELEYLEQYRRANNDQIAAMNLAKAAEKIKAQEEAKVYKNIVGAGGYSGEDIGKVAKGLAQFKPREITETYNYFKTYEGGKYFPLYKAYYGDVTLPQQKEIKKAIDNARASEGKFTSQVNEKVAQYIADYTPKKLAQDMALDMNNDKTKTAVNKYLTSAALTASEVGAGDVKNVLKLIAGEDGGKTKAVVRKLEDGTTQTVFISPDGSDTYTLPMNIEQRGFFPEVKQSSPYGYLKNYIEISPNRTADVMDKRGPQVDPVNAVSAPLTGFDLPGFANEPAIAPMVRFTPEGNHDNNGSSTDTYLLNMFIKDPKSNIWKGQRVTPRYVPWGGLENIMNNVGKDAYFEGLKAWK